MDKPKEMNYSIAPMRKILLTEAVSDGGTQEKAAALKGKWIRLNEHEYVLEEADKTTRVYNDETECGCACKTFNSSSMNVSCEHIIAFNDLPNPPQLSIESSQCRGLREVLIAEGWYVENRYLYPSLDDEQPDEPEVVTEPPLVEEEPVIDEEPEPKMIERKCDWCGHVESGTDAAEVKQLIAEHRETCPKNPANKKKTPKPTQEPVVKESLATEKPKEDKKVKPERKSTAVSTEVLMPSDAEFRDAKTERILHSQGGFYKVSGGKEVPDAMAVQAYAAGKAGISTEVLRIEQDASHVLAIIRCHRSDVYTDASVYIDFDVQRKRELLKIANKNPKAVRGWDESGPIFDPDFKVVTEKKSTPLMVYLFNRMTDFAYFAPRTAESQAIRRGQAKMLGSEWRDKEEIDTEAEEVTSM